MLTTEYRPVSYVCPDDEKTATAVVMWLLAQKLSGSGNYHEKDWRRIRQQRTNARQGLSLRAMWVGPSNLAWGVSSRLVVRMVDGVLDIDYQTGQSENEELTNIMRRLVKPEAEYLA
jgi:hypothetical protein